MSQTPSAHSQSVHSQSVQTDTHGDSGQIYVPVAAQRSEDISIGDEVQVGLHGLDGRISSIEFSGPQIAGDMVTIPADVTRMLGLEQGQLVEATFERVDDESSDEHDESADGNDGYADAIESESESESESDGNGDDDGDESVMSMSLDELMDDAVGADTDEDNDESENTDDESDNLGELFG